MANITPDMRARIGAILNPRTPDAAFSPGGQFYGRPTPAAMPQRPVAPLPQPAPMPAQTQPLAPVQNQPSQFQPPQQMPQQPFQFEPWRQDQMFGMPGGMGGTPPWVGQMFQQGLAGGPQQASMGGGFPPWVAQRLQQGLAGAPQNPNGPGPINPNPSQPPPGMNFDPSAIRQSLLGRIAAGQGSPMNAGMSGAGAPGGMPPQYQAMMQQGMAGAPQNPNGPGPMNPNPSAMPASGLPGGMSLDQLRMNAMRGGGFGMNPWASLGMGGGFPGTQSPWGRFGGFGGQASTNV